MFSTFNVTQSELAGELVKWIFRGIEAPREKGGSLKVPIGLGLLWDLKSPKIALSHPKSPKVTLSRLILGANFA